jgi:alpha-tubulin suppressor-like RCC1 family protein
MGTARTALLLSLLFVFLPLSQISADVEESPEISCTSNVVNAGQEIECSLDLSDIPGISSIRFDYVLEGENSASDSSVLALGYHHTCSILDNGTAICWGHDGYEQLGDGGNSDRHVRPSEPVSSSDGSTYRSIFSTHQRTCALTFSGSLFCWGQNDWGESGDGTSNTYSSPTVPVMIPSNRSVVTVGMGEQHTCAILDDDSLMCWGRDQDGEIGNGIEEDVAQYTPISIVIPTIRNAISVDGGHTNTCVLFDDGGIMCWGKDHVGQNGDGGSSSTTHSPGSNVALPEGRSAIDLSVGAYHSCAVLDDFSITCWGWNAYGQIGDNTTTDAISPVLVQLPAGAKATDVDAGDHHTCAVLENGSVNCWGWNKYKQVSGSDWTILTPQHVDGTNSFVHVVVAARHSCALAENGTISCWGENGNGQLGIGNTHDKNQANQLDWSTAPFASLSGPAPIGEWSESSPMRGQLISNLDGVWNISTLVPESTALGNYSLEISMLKIGGIRSSINLNNVIEIIGVDTDRDGVVDDDDAFPSDPAESRDSDSDGVGDNSDAFPSDSNETLDSDSDGVGDNSDAFPNNSGETTDSDGDGVGDNTDAYPFDETRINPSSPLMMYAPAAALVALLGIILLIRMAMRTPAEEKPEKKSRWSRKNPDRKF